jgi:hypothetical protein
MARTAWMKPASGVPALTGSAARMLLGQLRPFKQEQRNPGDAGLKA